MPARQQNSESDAHSSQQCRPMPSTNRGAVRQIEERYTENEAEAECCRSSCRGLKRSS